MRLPWHLTWFVFASQTGYLIDLVDIRTKGKLYE